MILLQPVQMAILWAGKKRSVALQQGEAEGKDMTGKAGEVEVCKVNGQINETKNFFYNVAVIRDSRSIGLAHSAKNLPKFLCRT